LNTLWLATFVNFWSIISGSNIFDSAPNNPIGVFNVKNITEDREFTRRVGKSLDS
jgi:hypothetical protein